MNGKRLIWLAAASITFMLLCPSVSWGAAGDAAPYNDQGSADANPGLYSATDDSTGPGFDIMTTNVDGYVISGQAFPEQPSDMGMVTFDFGCCNVAYFTGRLPGWGCFYQVQGLYYSSSGSGNGGINKWYSAFNSDGMVYIELTVVGYSENNNAVLYENGAPGGNLTVTIVGGAADQSYDIDLSNDPDSDGRVGFGPDATTTYTIPTPLAGNGGSATVDLYGLDLGGVTINAVSEEVGPLPGSADTEVVADLTLYVTGPDGQEHFQQTDNGADQSVGNDDGGNNPIWIAAGAIDDDDTYGVHTADIMITYSPNTDLLITMDNVLGNQWDVQLTITDADGTNTYYGDEAAEVWATTDANGQISGYLVSSDVLGIYNTFTVADLWADEDTSLSQGIDFVWDNEGAMGWTNGQQVNPDIGPSPNVQWASEQFLVPGGNSEQDVSFAVIGDEGIDDAWGLEQHQIGFYIEQITYLDANGNTQYLYNTSASPQNLGDWAGFAGGSSIDSNGEENYDLDGNDPDTCGVSVTTAMSDYGDAVASITLWLQQTAPNTVIDLKLRAYDLTVWYSQDASASRASHPSKEYDVNPIQCQVKGLEVYDPKLQGNPTATVSYLLTGPPGVVGQLQIMQGANTVATLLAPTQAPTLNAWTPVTWNGTWDNNNVGNYSGMYADPQAYTVNMQAFASANDATNSSPALSQSSYTINVVRLGVTEMTFENAGAVTQNFQLIYHFTLKTDTAAGPENDFALTGPVWKIGAADFGDCGDIDDNSGCFRAEAPPNPMLNFPEQNSECSGGVELYNFNRPVCYKVGSTPQTKVLMGQEAVSQVTGGPVVVGYGTGSGCPPIKLEPKNYGPDTAGNNVDIQPGTEYHLRGTDQAILGSNGNVQCQTWSIAMLFYYSDGSQWNSIPGYQSTTHSLYLVFDTPKGDMAIPWVKVLHRAVQWAQPIVHTYKLGGGVTSAPETLQPNSEANIVENVMLNMAPYLEANAPQNGVIWNFHQADNGGTFEERWRRMTKTPPATTYNPDDVMDEPPPASGVLGGDCASCAHEEIDALTALGIGPYVQDYVNEYPEPNPQLVPAPVVNTDGQTYFRGIYGGRAFNNWQGVCKSGNGATCYSVQGPHMATYAVMKIAPTAPPLNQPFDNVHAFEWYLWVRAKGAGDAAPYPAGYGEVVVGKTTYIYCTNIPNP